MNNLKKIGVVVGISALMLTGCATNENVEGDLTDLMVSVYENVGDDEKPANLENIEVTEDLMQYFIGTTDLEVEEILANESPIGSVAHSVVLIRVSETQDVEEAKTLIKENVDPRKWICVEAESVYVESKGDLIILVMSGTATADKIVENFKNL
ncbi:MAG: hypothetical protein R3Y21_03475 [Mycoplasmatota bacterium]